MLLVKNKKVLFHILSCAFVSILCAVVAFVFDWRAGCICLCLGAVLIGMDYRVTRRRYQEIARLSDYLHRIAGGDLSMELPDYQEGELSILRSNLYKTAAKLKFQAEERRKDKINLADSLADISHQLKTPITSMMVMSDLLKNRELAPERQQEFLTNLDRQLEKTQWIITNLLKLSKLDSGQIQLKEDAFLLSDMVEEAAAPFQIMAEVKGQTLRIYGDANAQVTGDRNWTGEAVGNLIKNCIEHTPQGGQVTVEYHTNALYTLLRVSDNGTGIAPEDLPHIFERFYKGKNSAPESVGIGLALSKTILSRENAVIEVKSEEHRGTAFEIRFYKNII